MSHGASWGVWWGLGLERPAWASLSPDLIRDQERDGLLPAGSAAQLGGVIVSKRLRGTLRPELVVAAGPQRRAQPGGGTFAELYGGRWALGLYKGGPRLYQAQAGVWVDRADPDALADLTGARHVALAWDQAARPVVAWERDALVYVRQWSPGLNAYVTRGPWAGCDPVLICDALVTRTPADSDVLLLHLDAGRGAVIGREQASSYATARTLAHVAPGSVLDQVAALPWALTVYGEADRTPWSLRSGLYPVTVADVATVRGSGLSAGVFVPLVIVHTPPTESVAVQGSGLSAGVFVPLVIVHAPPAEPVAVQGSGLSAGVFAPLVISRALPGDVGAVQASGLSGGTLARVVIVVSPPVEPVAAGIVTPLGGVWNG